MLRISRSSAAARTVLCRPHVRVLLPRPCCGLEAAKEQEQQHRWYGRTSALLEEKTVTVKKDKEEELYKKLAARDYNNRRAAYNRHVSAIRREYAEEVARQRATDKAQAEAKRQKLTRQRLERQRLKNIRSAENVLRQEAIRKQRAKEFGEHLERQQQIRDAKNERFRLARQLVLDELEKEAPLWLTTVDEVEAAFTHEAEQLLWARPGGVLGAPNPSLDAHFWQFETHTWKMERTYPSMRQVLLEELEEQAYQEANVDPNFWTPERVQEHEELERKAKLRASVHAAGVSELLRKQRDFLNEDAQADEIPQKPRAPSLNVLQNDKAIEEEGARLLMEDPTKFFVFENSGDPREMAAASNSYYAGPTLGAPVALRDPLRQETGSVFPQVIGKLPKPDTRSEREKKQEEREERMYAAAQAETKAQESDGTIELLDDEDLAPDLDYDTFDWDSDEEEWKQGLDPDADKGILETPADRRYSEQDIDWVLETMKGKIKYYEQQLAQDIDTIKQDFRSELRESAGSSEEEILLSQDSIEAALLKLPEQQLMALADLDERYTIDKLSEDEVQAAAQEIPGFTYDQIKLVLNRDRTAGAE